MTGNWLDTDEREDVAASLRHCIASLGLTKHDPHAYKWVLLALHSALQGSCVNHLLTTAHPVGATTENNTLEWLNYFELSRSDPASIRPHTRISELPELLKRLRKPNSAGDGSAGSEIFLTDAELQWWSGIHKDIRNQFVHFAPMGWSIELSGMPGLIDLTVRLIREIDSKQWAFRHESCAWKQSLRATLDELTSRASTLRQ